GNSLHQLAIACHAYHDARGSLPPSILLRMSGTDSNPVNRITDDKTTGTGTFGPNWVVLTLPYMEQSGAYAQASTTANPAQYLTTGDQNWKNVRSIKLAVMMCPSDATGAQETPRSLSGGGWARGNHACNAGGIHQSTAPAGTISPIGYLSTTPG